MTWQNILVLAVFISVCGFIAYAGDVLGRRMGKRRLTLFGLRPRYTAIITTTITGMFIAGFTIAVTATLSKDVKQLVLQGHKILQEYQSVQEAHSVAVKELETQRDITKTAREEAQEALEQQKILTAEISAVTQDLNKHRSELRKSLDELSENRKQLAKVNSRLEEANERIAQRQEEIEEAAEKLNLLQDELWASQADLSDTRNQLELAQARLDEANEEIAESEEEIASLKNEMERLEIQRARLSHAVETVTDRYLHAAEKYLTMRHVPVIFRHNQELARRVIQCAQPMESIRSDIIALLGQADRIARNEGARIGDNGRAIEIYPKKIETGPDGEGIFVLESDSINALAENIWSGSGSVVVLVLAIGNSIEGEQVMVDLMPIRNSLVYSSEQEIASTSIDGRSPPERIFEELIFFLRNEVRSAAVGKGVIPIYDEEGQPSIGAFDGRQLFILVDEIRNMSKPVNVRAVASDDIWSAGPIPIPLDLVIGDSNENRVGN